MKLEDEYKKQVLKYKIIKINKKSLAK